MFVAVVVSVAVLIFIFFGQVAEASRMMNLCSHTAYPSLCQPLVKRITNPSRATHRTIQALESKTKLALADAACEGCVQAQPQDRAAANNNKK
ncbi:BnaC08g14550D [Brassica napus]|uniref:Pectinesterase inhibitor domain-containing protein n=2 Tax=Brassica TaxID=3705 RepID=A0A0D3DNZ8_BRAOL|nr:unnamed protein product [Brassica napus]CDY20603.1 BnaC08g14550D [Brassica napus]